MSKLVARIIERYIGDFIELDKENFDISLIKETRIQNVAVKPDLLSQFVDSPIYGHVENISVNLNFGNTKPIEVSIDGVYVALLLTNADLSKSIDPAEAKRRRLAANDIQMKRKHGTFDKELRQQKKKLEEEPQQQQQQQQQQSGNEITKSEALSRSLLKRLSVKISNVHIRVETDGACFGITLDSLTLGTNRNIPDDDSRTPRNTFRLNNLAVYVDPPNAPGVTCPSKQDEFVQYLAGTESMHDYVLRPYSTSAGLYWPLSFTKENPPQARFVLGGDLDKIALRLSKEQYSRIFVSLDSLKRQICLPPAIREKRPSETVKEKPLKWFAYAAEAALYQVRDRRRRLRPDFFAERFRDKNKYCKLYKLRLLGKLDGNTLCELEAMEDALDMNDIIFYRSFAVAELSKSFQVKMKTDIAKVVRAAAATADTKAGGNENEAKQPPAVAPNNTTQIVTGNSSSSNTKFGKFFSKLRTGMKATKKELNEKTVKELVEGEVGGISSSGGSADEDRVDMALESGVAKSIPVFKMDLNVPNFEIVLENRGPDSLTPVLMLKSNLGVSLVMPTNTSTVTTISIDNLYGLGDSNTEFISYSSTRRQNGNYAPLITMDITADRGKTTLKAAMQPVDIFLGSAAVSRIVEYGMPPPQVNVKELGTQVWNYIYTYVLLVQDIEDSDGDNNRAKAGPGKTLENLTLDVSVESPSIRILSESAATTVVNLQSIKLESSNEPSETSKGLEFFVKGVSLETPGNESEPKMEIIAPFDIGLTLTLPILDSKKECDAIGVLGHVGSIQVCASEQMASHIVNASKPFCSLLAPLVAGYVNAVAQNMDERFGVDAGGISGGAKEEMTPVNLDIRMKRLSVAWRNVQSEKPSVTLDTGEGASLTGKLAHYCFNGEVSLPLLTIAGPEANEAAPILSISKTGVAIEDAGCTSCSLGLEAVDVNFDAGSAVSAISDILSTVQSVVPVINENFVKVAQENPVNQPLGSDVSKLFSVDLGINRIHVNACDEAAKVLLDIAAVRANVSQKRRDLVTVDASFSTVRGKATVGETDQFTFLELGDGTYENEKQTLKVTCLMVGNQRYNIDAALNHIYMNTTGLDVVVGLATRISEKIAKSLPPPQESKGESSALEKFLFENDLPSFLVDVDIRDISFAFVPSYVRNMELEFSVSRASYKNSDECPCGKALIRGVSMGALKMPLSIKPLDVEITPSMRILRAPQNRLFVEVDVSVSDVVLSMVPAQLPGMAFVVIGTVAQLFSTTMDTNPFPQFLEVSIPKVSVPHIEVHIKPNEGEGGDENKGEDEDDVIRVFIENLLVTGEMVYNRQLIAISGDSLCVVPNSDSDAGSLVQEPGVGKCAVFTIERRIDDDAFRYNIIGDINKLAIAEFDDCFLFQRMVPFTAQMDFDFNDLVLPSSCEKDKVPTFVSLMINLNSDVSLDYIDRARFCVRGPLSVAFDLTFHGVVLGYALRVDSKNEVFASDYKLNKMLSVLGLSFEFGFNHKALSASAPGMQLAISQISVAFWPGILSGTIIPILKNASESIVFAQSNEVRASPREQAVVPGFMDDWNVGLSIKKIDVDVRRLANSKDCNIAISIPGVSVEALLEQGKPISPALLKGAKLCLGRAHTVCDEFTLPFMDEASVEASTKDGALNVTTTPISINIQRSNLAVFYAIFHSIPHIVASVPKMNSCAPQKTCAEPAALSSFEMSICVPDVSLKWVNCFSCRAEGIFAQCKGGEDWNIVVKRLTASDENVNKMANFPILSLSENSSESEEKPSIKVSVKKSSEADLMLLGIDMSFIDVFFTPEIIGTVVSDIIWMKNYNDYNYDEAETIAMPTESKEEAEEKRDIAVSNGRSRIELRFNVERISVCVYEDHTTEYCLAKFRVSLDHFLLGLANGPCGTDMELFSVGVKDMNLEAGFACYVINKSGKTYLKDNPTKVVTVACNKIDVNLTDGVASSFYVEADPLSVNANAELLIPFIENHVKKVRVSLASASTGSKVDKRHFDTKHQNWNIPAQEMDTQKQTFEKKYFSPKSNSDDNNKGGFKIMQITAGISKFLEKKIIVKKVSLCGVVVDFFAPTTKSRVNLALFGVRCSLNNTQQRTLQFCLNASTSNGDVSSPLIIPWEANFMVMDMGYPSIQFTSNNFELSLNSHSLKHLCDVLDCFQVDDLDLGSEGASNENEYVQNQRYFTLGEINSASSVRVENLCKGMKVSVNLSLSPAAETIYQVDVEHWGVGMCKEATVGRGLEVAIPVQETDTSNVAYLIVSHSSGSENSLRVKSPLLFHNRVGRNVDVCFKPNFLEPKVFSVESNKPTVYGPPQFSSWSDHFFVGVPYGSGISNYSVEKFQPFYWNKNATQRAFEQVCIERSDSTPNQKKWAYLSILSLTSTKCIPLANGAALSTSTDGTAVSAVRPLECFFLPTLYIENALPTQIMVDLFDTISGEFSKIMIDGNRTVGIIEVRRRELISLSMTFTTVNPTENTPAASVELKLPYPPLTSSISEQLRYARTEIPVKVSFLENPKYDGIIFASLTKTEKFGIWKLRIYAKYLLMNTTGIPLVSPMGSSISVQSPHGSASLVKFDRERGLVLKERGSGMMVCLSPAFECYPIVMTLPQARCSVGVKVLKSGGAYAELHKIYIEHLYIIHNHTGESLILRQPQSEIKERQAERVLENMQVSPVKYSITTRDHIISVSLDGYTETIPFSVQDFIESTDEFIRIHSVTDRSLFKIIRVEIKKVEGTTHIIFHQDDGSAPFVLQNFSDIEIEYYQEGWKKYSQSVQPGKQAHFAWDSLAVEEKYLRIKGVLNAKIDICRDRSEGVFTVNNYQQGMKSMKSIKWTACVENGATVVRFFTKPRCTDLVSQSLANESSPEPTSCTIVSFAVSVPQIVIKLNERMVVLKLENTLFTYELDCIRGRTHNVKFTLENVEILSGGKKIFTNKHELNDIANAAVSLARPFWSYIFGGGGGGGSGSKASSSQQEAKSGDSKETKNFFEFTLRKKFREEPTEVHRFYKIYAKLTPITLTIEEQFVISVIKFIEEAIPSRILQGDDQAGASAPTQDPTADESSLQSHESDSGTTIIVGDLDLPELKINLSCKPANAKWKKAMLESSSSKRLMTLVDFITRFLGSFSNVPIEVAPLQRDGVLLFKNTDRLKEIILKHYGNQLIKRVIESSQGSGLLSTATYFAKVASKFGIFDNIL